MFQDELIDVQIRDELLATIPEQDKLAREWAWVGAMLHRTVMEYFCKRINWLNEIMPTYEPPWSDVLDFGRSWIWADPEPRPGTLLLDLKHVRAYHMPKGEISKVYVEAHGFNKWNEADLLHVIRDRLMYRGFACEMSSHDKGWVLELTR